MSANSVGANSSFSNGAVPYSIDPIRVPQRQTRQHIMPGTLKALLGVAAVLSVPLLPIVSLVALPLFSYKAAKAWLDCPSLKDRKLGNLPTQNYLRFDGKNIEGEKVKYVSHLGYAHGAEKKKHEWMGEDVTEFSTLADFKWLDTQHEYAKNETKFHGMLEKVKIFGLGLIPIIGVAYLYMSLAKRKASVEEREPYWDKIEAIYHHRAVLAYNLHQKGISTYNY